MFFPLSLCLCHCRCCSPCLSLSLSPLSRLLFLKYLRISFNTVSLFSTGNCHNSLWPKATTFVRSQRGYLLPYIVKSHQIAVFSTLKYGKQLVKLYGPASPYLSIFSILRRDSANNSFNKFTNKIGYNELLATSAACGTLDDL